MPSYIGLVSYKGNGKGGSAELDVAKSARQLCETHGGRILSAYWTEGEPEMVIAFEGRGKEQASKVFDDLASQQDVEVRMVRALTEGEKERAIQGQDV